MVEIFVKELCINFTTNQPDTDLSSSLHSERVTSAPLL